MKICALCGDEILKQDDTVEHVPPKLFYPKKLRPTIKDPFALAVGGLPNL